MTENFHSRFRVAGASFELGGVNYSLAANNGAHSLHGGTKGWDRRIWNSEVVDGGVVFSRLSSDGEEVKSQRVTQKTDGKRVIQGYPAAERLKPC